MHLNRTHNLNKIYKFFSQRKKREFGGFVLFSLGKRSFKIYNMPLGTLGSSDLNEGLYSSCVLNVFG